jgi:nickel superoxide dismutase
MCMNRKTVLFLVVAALLIFGGSTMVLSHCEIPCGIYNDPMRLDMMAEDIKTIEKSMNQITQLSADKDKDYNQLIRWVNNKEHHSDQLSDIVTQYFMKQRIKPVDKTEKKAYEEYINKLTLLHAMMVYSMKCKQTTDLEYVEKLRSCLTEFRTAYLGISAHEHN